jgi:hypothetical protein
VNGKSPLGAQGFGWALLYQKTAVMNECQEVFVGETKKVKSVGQHKRKPQNIILCIFTAKLFQKI